MYYYYDFNIAIGIIVGLIISVICCLASGTIAKNKGRDPLIYYLIGFLLPIIGLIITLVQTDLHEPNSSSKSTPVINSKSSLKASFEINEWYLDLPFEIVNNKITISSDKRTALLSLTMLNIGDKNIKSLYFTFECFDDTGEKLCSQEYAYQDLNIAKYVTFGRDIFIELPDAKTRKVNILFNKMSFTDGTVIKLEDIENKEALLDKEGQDIYNIKTINPKYIKEKFNNNKFEPKYLPIFESTEKWLCVCGRTNKKTKQCKRCKRTISDIETAFSSEKITLWEKEQKKKIEKQEKENRERQKKDRKFIIIVTATIAIIIAIIAITQSIKYNDISGTYNLKEMYIIDSSRYYKDYYYDYGENYYEELVAGETTFSLDEFKEYVYDDYELTIKGNGIIKLQHSDDWDDEVTEDFSGHITNLDYTYYYDDIYCGEYMSASSKYDSIGFNYKITVNDEEQGNFDEDIGYLHFGKYHVIVFLCNDRNDWEDDELYVFHL